MGRSALENAEGLISLGHSDEDPAFGFQEHGALRRSGGAPICAITTLAESMRSFVKLQGGQLPAANTVERAKNKRSKGAG